MVGMKTLDVDSVQAFVLVADLKSFTRAAEGLGAAQSAISLRIKRLEKRLGRRLFDRHPRLVRLSADGSNFLPAARQLLAAHQKALDDLTRHEQRLQIGISDHVAGPSLPSLLQVASGHDPGLQVNVHIRTSRELMMAYDRGEYDAVIVRREGEMRDGEVLYLDRLEWFASPGFSYQPGTELRLANLEAPCAVRGLAIAALDQHAIPWREVFVGGGVSAVSAAVISGFAVAALGRRVSPAGVHGVGCAFGLPPLPTSEILLHQAAHDERSKRFVATLAAAFRAQGD